MEEELPDAVKFKLYKRIFSQLTAQQKQQAQQEDPEKVIYSKFVDDKAVELMEKLKLKYPDVYKILVNELYKAVKNNLVSSIDGYTLYNIINALGLDVKPDIRIKFVKRGKEVNLEDYLH